MRICPSTPPRTASPATVRACVLAALAGAGLLLPVPAVAAEVSCPTGAAWIREEPGAGQPLSMTVAAPSLMLIVETCVSTGSNAVFASYTPGEPAVTIASPTTGSGDQEPISHVSYRVEMAPSVPGVCLPDLSPCPPGTELPDPAPTVPSTETPTPVAPPTPPAASSTVTPAPAPVPRPAPAPAGSPTTAPAAVGPAQDPEPVAWAAATATRGDGSRASAEPDLVVWDHAATVTAEVASAAGTAPLAMDVTKPAGRPAGVQALLGALLLGTCAAAVLPARRRAAP